MISPGDEIPSVRVFLKGTEIDLREYFTSHSGVLFCVPGAFASECTKKHLPGFKDAANVIKKHVDFLGCVAVNDPAVLKAWAQFTDSTRHITFISDFNGSLTRALGLEHDFTEFGLGFRSRRAAMILRAGKVEWLGLDSAAFVDSVLVALKVNATPLPVVNVCPDKESSQTKAAAAVAASCQTFTKNDGGDLYFSMSQGNSELVGTTFQGGADDAISNGGGGSTNSKLKYLILGHSISDERDVAVTCATIQSPVCLPVICLDFHSICENESQLSNLISKLQLYRVKLEECCLWIRHQIDKIESPEKKLRNGNFADFGSLLARHVPIAINKIFIENQQLFDELQQSQTKLWDLALVKLEGGAV